MPTHTQIQQRAKPATVQPTQAASRKSTPAPSSPASARAAALGHAFGSIRPRSGPRPAPPANGLPERLRGGVEALSGMDLSHVRVHRNSARPAQLNAHAFAQGSEIHLAPGQERYLPHEAWHVVQQAQGRVQATAQLKGGVAINDHAGLEQEADAKGAAAMAFSASQTTPVAAAVPSPNGASAVQRAKALGIGERLPVMPSAIPEPVEDEPVIDPGVPQPVGAVPFHIPALLPVGEPEGVDSPIPPGTPPPAVARRQRPRAHSAP